MGQPQPAAFQGGATMTHTDRHQQLITERDEALNGIDSAIAERDRQRIAAAINGPHRRSMQHNQKDAGHLPLFIAANEPQLF